MVNASSPAIADERLQDPDPGLLFTVFTPTFNRAHVLERVFRSLQQQTLGNFEWLIVDDGSTDNTREVVGQFRDQAGFPIRYLYQSNRGKHMATNLAVREAKGQLFLTVDSDDACTPQALERLYSIWLEIPSPERDRFSGVSVLCLDWDGRTIGTKFPRDRMDSDPVSLVSSGVRGEKWGFHRTEILRRFPFPGFPGETFLTEAVVWNRIAREYRMYYANEALRICFATTGGLSRGVPGKGWKSNWALRARNPKGSRLYYQECLAFPYSPVLLIRHVLNYVRFSFHAGVSARQTIRDSPRPLLTFGAVPAAAALYLRDRTLSIWSRLASVPDHPA